MRRPRRMRARDHVELGFHAGNIPPILSSVPRDNRPMLLAIDVGNTQTHLGAFRGDELAEHWRFRTVSGATGDEIAERVAGLLALSGIAPAEVDAICVSSVVPPLGGRYEAMTERYFDARWLSVGPGVKTGMPIRIDNPYEVGADRLVNAVAAYERFRAPASWSTSAPGSTSTPSRRRASISAGRSRPGSRSR